MFPWQAAFEAVKYHSRCGDFKVDEESGGLVRSFGFVVVPADKEAVCVVVGCLENQWFPDRGFLVSIIAMQEVSTHSHDCITRHDDAVLGNECGTIGSGRMR